MGLEVEPGPDGGESAIAAPPVESSGPGVAADVLSRVDGFITVRRGVKSVLDESPLHASQLIDPETGKIREGRDRKGSSRLIQLFAQVRVVQYELQEQTGISGEEYGRVRKAFRAWVEGSQEPGDPLGRAFEVRREELEDLYLGPLEPLDI